MTATLTRQDVQKWFTARIDRLAPGADRVEVSDLSQMSRGVSRETWLASVALEGATGRADGSFAVRRDHPTGSVDPLPLRTEYELYRRLGDTRLPVTRALWFEDDPAVAPHGRAAYVRTAVEGSWKLPVLDREDPDGDEARIETSKEHLRALAAVHAVDWEAHGFDEILDAPAGPADCAANLIRHYERRFRDIRFEPNAAFAEGAAWLRAHAPTDSPGVFLCKGTNGLGEEIWHDGHLVALSDWELASLGDPANDFAQCQSMIPRIVRDGRQIWGMDQALAYYQGMSGITVTKDRVAYYRRLYGLPQLMFTHHAAGLVTHGGAGLARFAWTATEMQYWAELSLGTAAGFADRKAG